MYSWVLSAVLAISSPSTQPVLQVETPSQVMEVPPELRARVREYVLAGSPSLNTRFDRLLHLIIDADELGLVYDDEATKSVAQSYATRSANCLSFTMMFIALAREVGLDARPQEVRDTLGWHQDNDIFYRVDHINVIVRIGVQRYLVDLAHNSVIELRSPEPVSDQRLLAHYYNNLAMGELENGRIEPAMLEMHTALQLDPGYATNWSNAGVLYLRSGDEAAAKAAYTKALALDPDNIGALANMANLLGQQGDHAREQDLRKQLDKQEQHDPFFHFVQAEQDEAAGDYSQAIEHFRQAIRLHGSEPRFYAALAHAFELKGDIKQAIHELTHAEWLSNGKARDDYRMQRDALRKTINAG